ncbi:MAG: HAD family hydrolase, partial [Bacteroidales bacterium]|nr:HAD family hydrolase [Bacteroidales bacterium]
TPVQALEKEWKEHGIDGYVKLIAGQEYGTKKEHIEYAAKGKYDDDKILMIGDAPGDMEAARQNGVLFYPVIPGREAESWARLRNEAFERFLDGSYKGDYADRLIYEFKKALPGKPPWEK